MVAPVFRVRFAYLEYCSMGRLCPLSCSQFVRPSALRSCPRRLLTSPIFRLSLASQEPVIFPSQVVVYLMPLLVITVAILCSVVCLLSRFGTCMLDVPSTTMSAHEVVGVVWDGFHLLVAWRVLILVTCPFTSITGWRLSLI